MGLWTQTLKFMLKIASQQRNHGNNMCVDLWSQKGPTITLPLDKQANKTQPAETNCSGWVITNRQHKPYMCITHPPTSTTLHCFINSTCIDLFFKPESLLKKMPTSLYLYTNKQTRANSRNWHNIDLPVTLRWIHTHTLMLTLQSNENTSKQWSDF